MWQRFAHAEPGAALPALTLETIWDVRSDPSYDVARRHASPSPRLIALCTTSGQGQLWHWDCPAPLTLGPETLLLTPLHRIARYRCAAATWDFWWFEFAAAPPAALPLDRVLPAAVQARDGESVESIVQRLRRDSPATQRQATATFAMLLYRWLATEAARGRSTPHAEALERLLELLHQEPGRPWRVTDMARTAGLGERRFRELFQAHTGKAPKAYYEELRLRQARELLRQGLYSLAEIADRLGYSSAFHLSHAYRRFFGHAPSHEGRPRSA